MVQTKLECCEESATCPDFSNRLSEIAIAPFGDALQGGFEGQSVDGQSFTDQGRDGQSLDGRAPTVQPCEVTFAEEEPCMLMGPDDDDWDVYQASQALIEWRHAIAETPAGS